MEREDLVSVCSVSNPMEAEIIRNALESAGIACEIGGEMQAGLAGVLQIDILTHAEDAEEARGYLAELKDLSRADRKIAREKSRQGNHNEAIEEHNPRTGIQPSDSAE